MDETHKTKHYKQHFVFKISYFIYDTKTRPRHCLTKGFYGVKYIGELTNTIINLFSILNLEKSLKKVIHKTKIKIFKQYYTEVGKVFNILFK